MMINFLTQCYPELEKDLVKEIEEFSILKEFSSKEFIVNQGETIRFLPIIVIGKVKVFSVEETMSFLLYFINSGESCIYSFAHVMNNEPASFSAVAETDCTLLLLPKEKVNYWINKYTSLAKLVIKDYQKHYADLLQTTKSIICQNLDERLLDYLKTKAKIANSNVLSIKHQEIADDLGTSREVITRLLKKLSNDKLVEQIGRKIKII